MDLSGSQPEGAALFPLCLWAAHAQPVHLTEELCKLIPYWAGIMPLTMRHPRRRVCGLHDRQPLFRKIPQIEHLVDRLGGANALITQLPQCSDSCWLFQILQRLPLEVPGVVGGRKTPCSCCSSDPNQQAKLFWVAM